MHLRKVLHTSRMTTQTTDKQRMYRYVVCIAVSAYILIINRDPTVAIVKLF